MSFFTGITHEDGTKLIPLQYAITLCCNLLHFFHKVLYRQKRQISVYIFTIINNIGIGRMGTDQIDAFILQKIQVPSIALTNGNFSIRSFMLKIRFFTAPFQRRIIYIDTYTVSVQQLRLYQGCSAADKLIQYEIACL